MKTLFEKLSKENQAKLSTPCDDFPFTQSLVKKVLNERRHWINLTLAECDNICIILLGESFKKETQVIKLFI